MTPQRVLMCRRMLVYLKIFVSDAVSLARELKHPPFREVVKLTLLAVAAIGMLMLLISAMDFVFYKILAESRVKSWAHQKALLRLMASRVKQ